MGKFIDKTGQTFGYLTVLGRCEEKTTKVMWHCRCQCGNELDKRSDALNDISMCKNCNDLYRKGFLLSPAGELHPQISNEVGNRYGKLTVDSIYINLDKTNRGVSWKCKCDCGNYKIVSGKDLRRGGIKSCGCLHHIEEQPGTKYGKLTIIERVENSKAGKTKYKCLCDCGNYCIVTGSDLRSGSQQSCGCLKSKGELAITQLLINNHLQFEKEAKFATCKDINELPFDFKINTQEKFYLIEYDGKQHFSLEHSWDQFSFEQTQKHDAIKNQWCKDNNIPLIRIPYTHLDKLCLKDLQLETSQFIV